MINFDSLNMEATKKLQTGWLYLPLGIVMVLIFAISTFVGCSKKDKKPADVLDKQQLSSVMIDIYLAEAKLSSFPIARDSSLKLFLPREAAILSKRNIPDSVLKKTYAYYLGHPDDFNEVYDIIIDSLTVMEKRKAASVPAPK
jgi:hypothetical protein